jgi:hypothetical protein
MVWGFSSPFLTELPMQPEHRAKHVEADGDLRTVDARAVRQRVPAQASPGRYCRSALSLTAIP